MATARSEPTLLVDSGVWIAAQDDEDSRYRSAREFILDSGWTAVALDLTLYEIVNVVVRRWRSPTKATELCRSTALRCRNHFVRIDADLLQRTAKIAVEYRITAYDAAYVAVADRHGWRLVSTDVRDLVSKGLAITPDAAV